LSRNREFFSAVFAKRKSKALILAASAVASGVANMVGRRYERVSSAAEVGEGLIAGFDFSRQIRDQRIENQAARLRGAIFCLRFLVLSRIMKVQVSWA
jgi:hypothetical protein